MTYDIEWDKEDLKVMTENERRQKEFCIKQGYFSLGDNQTICRVCQAISIMPVSPKAGNYYQCQSCKCIFLVRKLEETDREYDITFAIFQGLKEFKEYLKLKTKEEFKATFHKNEKGIFVLRKK